LADNTLAVSFPRPLVGTSQPHDVSYFVLHCLLRCIKTMIMGKQFAKFGLTSALTFVKLLHKK
jgi:hypothetical protein